jgi:hypothetical protein
LIIVTPNNVMSIPPDGLAGAYFQGSIIYNNNYQGQSHRNAVSNRYGTWGLEKNGVVNVNTGEVLKIKSFDRIRKITAPVGLGRQTDVRSGKLWAYDEGVMISFGAGMPFCVLNMSKNYVSWWDGDGITKDIVGVSTASDGRLMITTGNAVHILYGDAVNCTMGLACEVELNGVNSVVVREIIVTCTGTGSGIVRTAIRGNAGTVSDQSTYSPKAVGSVATDNDGVWSQSKLVSSEFASATHQRAVRTDGVFFEVGVTKNTVIQSVHIQTEGQGKLRDRYGNAPEYIAL